MLSLWLAGVAGGGVQRVRVAALTLRVPARVGRGGEGGGRGVAPLLVHLLILPLEKPTHGACVESLSENGEGGGNQIIQLIAAGGQQSKCIWKARCVVIQQTAARLFSELNGRLAEERQEMTTCEELMMDSFSGSKIKLTMKSGTWIQMGWKKRRFFFSLFFSFF